MSQALYQTYERELQFLRQMSQDFARHYPGAAGKLLLEPNRSVDPHVERLIEANAFLAARVQHKLDDDFPELTDALLSVLYPHYLAPVPSTATLQFELDPANAQPGGVTIPRHSRLHTQKVADVACQFRTCYPVTLWPLSIANAQLQTPPFPPGFAPPPRTAAALRLAIECQGDLQLADLSLDKLRLNFYGDNQTVASLYELIFNHAVQVVFRPVDRQGRQEPLALSPTECLHQVGFERDEGLLPYPNRSFLGYRLLTEFFAAPHKFHYLDLGGWKQAARHGLSRRLEVVIYLNRTNARLEQELTAEAFRLGATPVVNLFEQTAEPIALTHAKSEYRVVPDVHHQHEMEVYSIDRVLSADPASTFEYKPFYSFRHDSGWHPDNGREAYWYASRQPALEADDRGSEAYLHLVDLDFDPHEPAESVLVVRTTCTNRDLPVKLQQLGDSLSFELEAAAPVKRIRCLRTPTAPLRPPLRRGAYWRLISHLSLNQLSLADGGEGRAALQEMLRLYDFSDAASGQQLAAVNRQLIEGIVDLSSRRTVGRLGGSAASGFCRGVEITLQLDEQKLLGSGAFLFASVLERFFALYTSINSFTQLAVKTSKGEDCLKRWPPRAGEQPQL